MSAHDLFKQGYLVKAIEAQLQVVKAKPADTTERLFYFELLSFNGDLERGRKQLDVMKFEQVELEAAVVGYRMVLSAEAARRKAFKEGIEPKYLSNDPSGHLKLRWEAVLALKAGDQATASAKINEANDLLPPIKGLLNTKPFDVLRDGDDLFAGCLEVFAKGEYYWVAMEDIEILAMNPPKFPRDLLWVPARLETRKGSGEVFLPSLYYGTHEQTDESYKLGRGTDWKTLEGGAVLGIGLRTYLVGEDTQSLLDWRELEVDDPTVPTPDAPEAAAPEAAAAPAVEPPKAE